MKRIDIEDMRDVIRDYYVQNPPDDIVIDGTDDAQRITDDTIRWVDELDEVDVAERYVNIVSKEHKKQMRDAIDYTMRIGEITAAFKSMVGKDIGNHHIDKVHFRRKKKLNELFKTYNCEKTEDAE